MLHLVEDLDRVIAKCKATYQISPNSTKCEARKGKSWEKMGKEEARSLWKRKKKLAHENKSFSAPPRNVWFQVAAHQITWYRSRSAYWLLIEGSIKAHWLMTLYDLKKMIYADRSRLRRRFLSDEGAAFTLLFRFENRRARERSERPRESPLRWWSINSLRFFFSYAQSTISKEKVEGLWTGYEGACYYFSELYKRSQVTMLTSWKVYLACLSLG